MEIFLAKGLAIYGIGAGIGELFFQTWDRSFRKLGRAMKLAAPVAAGAYLLSAVIYQSPSDRNPWFVLYAAGGFYVVIVGMLVWAQREGNDMFIPIEMPEKPKGV